MADMKTVNSTVQLLFGRAKHTPEQGLCDGCGQWLQEQRKFSLLSVTSVYRSHVNRYGLVGWWLRGARTGYETQSHFP
jgi:hypothetical protein